MGIAQLDRVAASCPLVMGSIPITLLGVAMFHVSTGEEKKHDGSVTSVKVQILGIAIA